MRPVFSITYFTLLESFRAMRVIVPVFLLILAASFFIRELAIIESMRMQTVFVGAVSRFALCFILSLFVIVSVVREFNDKGLEVILALDVTRSTYVFGKFLGYSVLGLFFTLLCSAVLVWFVPLAALFTWASFFLLELIILVALSLFAAIGFTSIVPATSFVFGFYLLGRSITAIQLISTGPLAIQDGSLQNIVSGLIQFIGLFIPRLSDFTQTAWLVNSGSLAVAPLGALFAHGVIFVIVILAAAIIDLHRKDF